MKTAIGSVLVMFVAALPAPVFAADGDETLLYGRQLQRGEIASTCFARRYDKAHLGSHPHQNVTEMRILSYRPDWPQAESIINLEFRFRGVSEAFQLSGGCRPVAGKAKVLDCAVECDGGLFSIRREASGSLMVDIPAGLALCDGDEALPAGARFGSDDRRFRLGMAEIATCRDLVWDDEIRPKLLQSGSR
ncbi:hypothetical protein DFR48_10282 [Ciceribacter lividus]|uniref:Uncharacterized protein n=1 Tax=Ciceribacter lividus TaxID=1197950 RepID=A0A6I7HPB2_9HYPH|nr:hypothetical protein [Ciceribacter lividus]RCW27598.1 hypothetical protein DFR48_10282 [Ciceribacter lividus]